MNCKTLALAAGILMGASASFAQCDTYQTVMQMGRTINSGLLLEQTLDNGAEFIFFADGWGGAVVLYLDEDGGHACTGWNDLDGVGYITDGLIECTVRCKDGTGVLITVEAPGMDPQMFAVGLQGETLKIGPHAYRQVYNAVYGADATDWTLTATSLLTPNSPFVTGVNENADPFVVSATNVLLVPADPNEPNKAATYWIGTLSTLTGSVPCAGLSIEDDGVFTIIPLIAYCNEADGLALNAYFAATNCGACQIAICPNWDSTAQLEYDDAVRENNTCVDNYQLTRGGEVLGCGLLVIIGCGTSWLPTGVSQAGCGIGLVCVAHGLGYGLIDALKIKNQWNNVKDCICAHAAVRANNGPTPAACVFTCPN
jgi:hypothetical protein